MKRIDLHLIDQSSATNGQVPLWNATLKRWVPAPAVSSLTPGTGIAINTTDPSHPVISSTLSLVPGAGIDIDSSIPASPIITVERPVPAGGATPNVLTQLSGGTLSWLGNVVVLIPHGGTVPVGTPVGAIIVEKA